MGGGGGGGGGSLLYYVVMIVRLKDIFNSKGVQVMIFLKRHDHW